MKCMNCSRFVYNIKEPYIHVGVNQLAFIVEKNEKDVPHLNSVHCPLNNGHFCFQLGKEQLLI